MDEKIEYTGLKVGDKAIVHDLEGNEVEGTVIVSRKVEHSIPDFLKAKDEGQRYFDPSLFSEETRQRLREEYEREKDDSLIGKKAIIHDLEGNEVVGTIVYARKANYDKPDFIKKFEKKEDK